MDNAKIHHGEDVVDLIESFGTKPLCIPLYKLITFPCLQEFVLSTYCHTHPT